MMQVSSFALGGASWGPGREAANRHLTHTPPPHSAAMDRAGLLTSPFLHTALYSKQEMQGMHSQHTLHFLLHAKSPQGGRSEIPILNSAPPSSVLGAQQSDPLAFLHPLSLLERAQ